MPRGIPSEVVDRFRRIPLFESISNKSLRTIISVASEVDVRAGKTLVREGDQGRELYVVLRGAAEVFRGGRKISELIPGDYFGEMALLSPGPRTATVTARTDMRVMVLEGRGLDEVMVRERTVSKRLLQTMARRVRATERANPKY